MARTLQDATDFRELLGAGGGDGPYLYSELFPDTGWLARRRSRRRFTLLQRIDAVLRSILHEGEQVFFVTRGTTAPSLFEWFFLGWVMYYLNRRAVVLTSHRVLLLQITSQNHPRELRGQIRYATLAEMRSTLLGNAVFAFHNGKRLLLTGVQRADRKYLRTILNGLVRRVAEKDKRGGVEDLCPHCGAVAMDSLTACGACGGRFKSARTAALLSLVFPGTGDYYLGHHGFAVLELIGGSLVWLGILAVALDPTIGPGPFLASVFWIVLFVHGLDAVATLRIATKGLYPEPQGAWSTRKRFIAAGVPPALVLLVAAVSLPGKAGLVPGNVAVWAPEDLSPRQHEALRTAGFLERDEQVHWFYSNGITSVLEDGNFFTDERVVSYAREGDEAWHASADFEEIEDVRVVYAPQTEMLTNIVVRGASFEPFYLIVSPREGGDTAFAQALETRWQEMRLARKGIWFDGDGFVLADPIHVRGTDSYEEARRGELHWVSLWLGSQGFDWTLLDREEMVLDDGSGPLSVVRVVDASGDYTFYFDVSEWR